MFFLALVSCVALLGCATPVPMAPLSGGASATPTSSPETRSSPPVSAHTQEQSQVRLREQSAFGAEEEVEHPVNMPEDVLRILRRDERNQRRLAEGQSPDDMPASWFVASEIHLNEDDLPDLVVMAATPRLFGANIVPFWIFRNTPQGHKLALSVSALGLEVLNNRTNGYRDIHSIALSAREEFTTTYKFNGNEYREWRSSQRPL